MAYNDWLPGEEITSEKLNDTVREHHRGRIAWGGYGALAAYNFTDDVWASQGSILAIGYLALNKLTDAREVTAIGDRAMENSVLVRDNVGIGSRALRNVQSDTIYYDQNQQAGTRNVGIGSNALLFTNKGYAHTALGRNSGGCVVDGTGLVALGYGAVAGYQPIGLSGDQENWSPFGTGSAEITTTAVGYRAAEKSSASNLVAVGGRALTNNKRSEGNVGIGSSALAALDSNTGYGGGTLTTLGINGTYSQVGNVLTIVTASAHTLVVGDTAFFRLLDGLAVTFANDQAPAKVLTVPNSTTFTVSNPTPYTTAGTATLYSKESAAQVAQAGNNTAVGYRAGAASLSGTRNLFLGSQACEVATLPAAVTAVGSQAFASIATGGNSVAVGYFAAGNMATDATQVTAIGSQSMRNKIDGSVMTEAFTNITALGAYTGVSASNQLQLGNSAATTYVYGTVQNRSDARDKADVRDTQWGLEELCKLHPVDFRWDMREDYIERDDEGAVVNIGERDGSKKRTRFHHGLIAQEVVDVIEETGKDFGGLQDHSLSDGGSEILSIGYDEFVGPLIRAVQELAAMNEALSKRVSELEGGR